VKAHLVATADPLLDHGMVETLCSQTLYPAKQVFMWDEQIMGAELLLSAVNTCRTCIDRSREQRLAQAPRRYVYGVVKGEIEA
jgi:hypothetical protein